LDLIASSIGCLIYRVAIGYCNSSAVASVGKAKPDACPDCTVVVASVAADVATTVVVVDVIVATMDVDTSKPPDAANLDAIPADTAF
jgi:hypothetical protein